VLEAVTGEAIPRGEKLDVTKIGALRPLRLTHISRLIIISLDYIRLSTTVATNALLERKGRKHALLITKGFKDLLLIGNQSRPRIFDLNIRRPPPLYSTVMEIDERVTLVGYTSDPHAEDHQVIFDENGQVKRGYRGKGWDQKGDAEGPGRIVQGISGEAVRVLTEPGICNQSPLTAALLTQPFFTQMRLLSEQTCNDSTVMAIVQLRSCLRTLIPFPTMSCSSEKWRHLWVSNTFPSRLNSYL